MSLAAPRPILSPRAAYTDEPIFRLTVDQYHELIRSGKLTEQDPVELVEGVLVYKMPKKSSHTTAGDLTRRAIERLLPAGWFYRAQDPITLSDGEPEPDGAVVRGRIEDYAARHPGAGDVALVIEVTDTTVERDRGMKLRSYARAGVGEYWIVNLIDRRVEVYREPDPGAVPEPAYRRREAYGPGQRIAWGLGEARHEIDPGELLGPPG